MEIVLRAAAVYLFLLVVFRLAGKRTLGEITTFDFVLLLVISAAMNQALLPEDHSLTGSFLTVLTFVGLDIGFTLLKRRSARLDRLLEGAPVVIVEDGHPIRARLEEEEIDEEEILVSARENHGLERMDQIRYAVLETSGSISIIPKEAHPSRSGPAHRRRTKT
jgi:uncharacterized membrane protein YcaP (DUF421 family)